MRTFLYATDCSKSSVSALKYAYKMSQAVNAELHVLHVFDLLPMVSASVRSRGVLVKNFKDEQRQLLRQFCYQHLEEEFGKPELFFDTIRDKSVSNAILEKADKISADLVIIGAASLGSIRGIFAENIADELIPRLRTKLLVLPEFVNFQNYSSFLYATDFEEADIVGLQQLIEIAEPFKAHIQIVHIPRQNEESSERRMYWFKQLVLERISYPELSFGLERAEDVESGIHDYIENAMPDVLVMMERPRATFWSKLLHKDLVKTMGNEVSIPFMVFNKEYILQNNKQPDKIEAVL